MNDMVLIWNGKSCNKHQEKTTMALAYRIQIYERYRKGISLEIGNLYANESEQFDIFKENFFSYMSDVPLSGDFPKFPEFVPDNNILIKRNVRIVRVLNGQIHGEISFLGCCWKIYSSVNIKKKK